MMTREWIARLAFAAGLIFWTLFVIATLPAECAEGDCGGPCETDQWCDEGCYCYGADREEGRRGSCG